MLSNAIFEVWVGAQDVSNNDAILWIDNILPVDQSLWIPAEPDHANGNCVYLTNVGDFGLAVDTCLNNRYLLCKASPLIVF